MIDGSRLRMRRSARRQIAGLDNIRHNPTVIDTAGDRAQAIDAVFARLGELDMTQADLVAATELGPTTVNRILNGRQWPQPRTRSRIAKALNWRADALDRIARGEDPANMVRNEEPQSDRNRIDFEELIVHIREDYQAGRYDQARRGAWLLDELLARRQRESA